MSGFDKLAKPYRWMEYVSFGPLLQRCRTAFLPQLRGVKNALVLGDGDGRFTAALLKTAPTGSVTAVDGSAAMLQALRSRCGGQRVTTVQAMLPHELDRLPTAQHFDLIATHFFLDCLTSSEAAELSLRIQPLLAKEATWVVSDFAVPRGAMRLPSALLVALLYRAFRVLTGLKTQQLPDHMNALRCAGWRCEERRTMLGGLLFSELWRHGSQETRLVKER